MSLNLGKVAVCGSSVLGALGACALIKGASKLTKSPVGVKGSIAHIATNDKLDKQAKKDTFVQITKQIGKDALGTTATAVATGGVVGLLSKLSPKAGNFFEGIKGKIGGFLDNIAINGKSIKEMITNTKIYKKINALPAPAKAAITAGVLVLSVLGIVNLAKQPCEGAYIEAQNEK